MIFSVLISIFCAQRNIKINVTAYQKLFEVAVISEMSNYLEAKSKEGEESMGGWTILL